ncbi:MAG: glutamine-hydrolyzing carbamoyl-phosphate synthase small subunit [Candidatus Margulisbacteria bacterium]|nr:glutamine-hydrolyzing carbamoyl-phosphate synthase small subunit [Candidatus Margulisiibacteriota bacterium]
MVKAILVLEDGRFFLGESFGAEGEVVGEVVFNTSMAGYQEILTDPSSKYQILTMTYPVIGNYGVNDEDVESDKVQVSGFVVKEYSKTYSNFRAKMSLGDYLKKQKTIAIEGIDTRALTRHLRDNGTQMGIISTKEFDVEKLVSKIKKVPGMEGTDLVKDVTTKKVYSFTEKSMKEYAVYANTEAKDNFHVVVYDFGAKTSSLRALVDRGCKVTVVPATMSYKQLLDTYSPDGVLLSNGPGDPTAVTYAIENIRGLLNAEVPLFGACLGHLLLGLALGAETYKLKFGHRGSQPVKNLKKDKTEIASHNHGFAIKPDSMPKNVEVTHLNLNDQTVAGIRVKGKAVFSVQYHPEASSGPHDSDYLFDAFIESMRI